MSGKRLLILSITEELHLIWIKSLLLQLRPILMNTMVFVWFAERKWQQTLNETQSRNCRVDTYSIPNVWEDVLKDLKNVQHVEDQSINSWVSKKLPPTIDNQPLQPYNLNHHSQQPNLNHLFQPLPFLPWQIIPLMPVDSTPISLISQLWTYLRWMPVPWIVWILNCRKSC